MTRLEFPSHLRKGSVSSARPLVAFAGFGLALAALGALGSAPAQAHGVADGGLMAGGLHPLLGLDHLLLLLGVGAAGAALSPQLLLWGGGGALLGAVFGAFGGSLPSAELLAALAVPALALLVLRSLRQGSRQGQGGLARNGTTSNSLPAAGALIAAAVAVHAMLHGQEAPQGGAALAWWLGAALASLAVAGSTTLLLRRLPRRWTGLVAAALVLAGGALALVPLA